MKEINVPSPWGFRVLVDTKDELAGKTQRNRVEREVEGRIGMRNTCKSMADSCRCVTDTTTIA